SVSATSLTVYKSASTSSQKLGTLKYGDEVTVYAYNADWAYIGLNNRYGFCSLKGLVKGSITPPEVEEPSTEDNTENDSNNAADLFDAIPATVTASSVIVYESASTSSKKLGKLNKGAEVNVLQTGGNWAYIELNGNYGYCAISALTKTSDLQPETQQPAVKEPIGTATVITATAKMGDSKTGGNLIAELSMGDTVKVYDHGSKWAEVSFGDYRGYMAISSLSAQSYAELKEGDSGAAVSELASTLLLLGHFDGELTANYTTKTSEAVKRLQAACGMDETGVADEALLRVIYSGNAPVSPILKVSLASGSKGENVTRIQNRLLALGFLSSASSVDGDYGSTTANAVSMFQKASGANATGTADTATIRALYSTDAAKLPSGSKPADYKAPASSGGSSNSGSISSDIASTTDTYSSNMSNREKLEYVIYVAQQQLGKKYVFGNEGPSTFDCSGLTYYCFKKIGVTLKRTAYADGYNDKLQKISGTSALKRGDLVFFNTVSDSDLSDHIGIYLGKGYFIHASSGAGKVVVSDLSSGYYNRVYSWGRRVLDT
ncbi:MAG: SH3 domain-containing protein, partial [Clostridia bacterium]|nr:SH3 domain-containing protein [Clostridia bacterium]